MSFHNPSKNSFFLVVLLFFLLLPVPFVEGGDSGDPFSNVLETKHTVVHYQSLKDLKKFDDKVAYSPVHWSLKRLFVTSGSDRFLERLSGKIDALHERVQNILDMRKNLGRVTIHVYRDREQLKEAYYKIYKKPGPYRAWYIFEFNTVYVSVDDLHEGMLAHEIAHSIIDNYLTVRPPKATAEILARYVDRHLCE